MEREISGHTDLYCLIGSPVGHSGSPLMYNFSFKKTGTDAVYLAFDIPLEMIEQGIMAVKTLHVKGFNVTMPNKTAVMKYIDEADSATKLIGACNTVIVSDEGKLIGYNTDRIGFVNNLRAHGIEMKGKKIVLLGAGGAATAICVQAALEGAEEITIFNRNDEFYDNGKRLVERLKKACPSCKAMIYTIESKEILSHSVKHADILINATKTGMKPLEDISLVDSSLFHSDLVVADTVYEPLETRLIREAKNAGCKVAIGGIGMLLWQGAEAFRLFTGKEMPIKEVQNKFFHSKEGRI